MTTNMGVVLWELGAKALGRLEQCWVEEDDAGILEAKATLAGTFALMATHRAHDASRGLRLWVLLMFNAELHGKHDANNRVSLPSFIANITEVNFGWKNNYSIPNAMDQETWQTLASLVRGHDISADVWFQMKERHPLYTKHYWQELARHIRTIELLETVLH